MTTGAFSYLVRKLVCHSCGAPIDAPIEGGRVACGYCGAISELARRSEEREVIHDPDGAQEDRARVERLERLRAQANDDERKNPYLPRNMAPELLARFARRPTVETHDEVVLLFRDLVKRVVEAPTPELERQLFAVSLQVSAGHALKGEFEAQRAVLETVLDRVGDSAHRHMIYRSLSAAAVRDGDLDAAERWIAHCDPVSDVLELDTDYRTGAASIALAKEDFQGALALLGETFTEARVPISKDAAPLVALYRAHALEAMGRPRDADAELAEVGRRTFHGNDGWAVMEAISAINEWRGLAAAPVERARGARRATGRGLRIALLLFSGILGLAVSDAYGWGAALVAALALPTLLLMFVLVNRRRVRRLEALRRRPTER